MYAHTGGPPATTRAVPGPPMRVRLLDVSAAQPAGGHVTTRRPRQAEYVVARPPSKGARRLAGPGPTMRAAACRRWWSCARAPLRTAIAVCSCVQIRPVVTRAPCADKLAWVAQIDVHGGRVGFL